MNWKWIPNALLAAFAAGCVGWNSATEADPVTAIAINLVLCVSLGANVKWSLDIYYEWRETPRTPL